METHCPRLRRQLDNLTRMYTHLEEADLAEMCRYHCCPECPGAQPLPLLPRDPQEDCPR